MGKDGEAIEYVHTYAFYQVPHGGEVMDPIPLVQQLKVSDQFGLCFGPELEREPGQPATELPDKLGLPGRSRERAHAADLARGAARRFRCTSRSEIAAGVTPEIRDAWPRVSGRC